MVAASVTLLIWVEVMVNQKIALQALQATNFDWTMHIRSIWRDLDGDVAKVHQRDREVIFRKLDQLTQSQNIQCPLGTVIIGPAGSGKTHLLSVIRKYSISQGLNFILVDMTDVRDFWETVLQGFISSLQEIGSARIPQCEILINCLIGFTGKNVPATQLARAPENMIKNAIRAILNALAKPHRQETLQYQDIIRALILLNSQDFTISGIGYNWLQGFEIEENDKANFGFRSTRAGRQSEIVKGLSWIANLYAPTVLALDQLDALVMQHHFAAGASVDNDLTDEQRLSRAIIEGIGGGLMALRDESFRTLTVISCLRATWEILKQNVVKPFQDRFEPEISLSAVRASGIAQHLVQLRLERAYKSTSFQPPYPAWPFTDQFFQEAQGQYPRNILQRCSKHRDQCISHETVVELEHFDLESPTPTPLPPPPGFDREFVALQSQVEIAPLLNENNEDSHLGILLQVACECLQVENPTPSHIDTLVEAHFPGGKDYPLLHARARLVFHEEGDRETHLCLRALQHSHATAFQARLRAAMTASGIDRALSFRKLAIVRTQALPRGAKTKQLIDAFTAADGVFLRPTDDELRILGALHQLKQQQLPDFERWLRDRRPVSQLPFMQKVVNWLFAGIMTRSTPSTLVQESVQPQLINPFSFSNGQQLDIPGATGDTASPFTPQDRHTGNPGIASQPQIPRNTQPQIQSVSSIPRGWLPIGARLVGQQTREPIAIRLEDLTKHAVILAGSGSGKTVLVKRLVEEAALQGIPAIVIDGANDLSRMGDRWPHPPDSWSTLDHQKADSYHQATEVIVWTPGREAGNPLNLEPLPNFEAIAHDSDELEQAIDMARDSLQEIVATGNAANARIKRGILRKALEYFASSGGGTLEDFASLVSDLPPDAAEGFAKAQKLIPEMSDLLMAEIANNPLLRQSGMAMNPATLFGIDRPSETVRISIINLVGLAGLPAQQQFLNQLAMTLFTWIKKNPAPPGVPLRGLMVIDEAKDFVPSIRSTPCKASLIRLTAQARKYGLGLIFATQEPKSIDNQIIANCSTQFYGRTNAPIGIDVIRQQLMQRGGTGQDIANLEKGQFYAVSEALPTPTKIQSPLCLSYHPANPPDELEVLALARASRI